MLRVTGLLLAAVGLLIGACSANSHSIFRQSAGDGSKVVFTDAKQSATIVQLGEDGVMRACAARSPDVLAALDMAIQANASVAHPSGIQGGGQVSGTSSENAAAFGLRTQLTQSQIELLYQLCVSYLNGAIGPEEVALELHRYQNTMVTMLAVEQLTRQMNASSSPPSADSIKIISEAISRMHATHVSQTFLADECGRVLFRNPEKLTSLSEPLQMGIVDICSSHYQHLADLRKKALLHCPPGSDCQISIVPPGAPPPAPYLVLFDFDKSELNEAAQAVLDQVAADFMAGASTAISVTAYADRSGSGAYNQQLAERRAESVKEALIRRGIPRGAITTAAKGETENAVPTPDAMTEQANRRAEIVIQ